MSKKEIKKDYIPIILDKNTIKDAIYEIRGQKVMLDFDLAKIYGYETKNFNRQVKNNIDKFPDEFRFQLTKEGVPSCCIDNTPRRIINPFSNLVGAVWGIDR